MSLPRHLYPDFILLVSDHPYFTIRYNDPTYYFVSHRNGITYSIIRRVTWLSHEDIVLELGR
jgi:hypothetical protein